MKTNDKNALHYIMNSIKAGYSFGKDCTWNYYSNKPIAYPYFSGCLYMTFQGSIGWTHYGSSANKCTLKDLLWIITTIFDTTPSDFLEIYIRSDESKIKH